MAGQVSGNILPPEVHKVIQTLTSCNLQHQEAVRPVALVMTINPNHPLAELVTTLSQHLRPVALAMMFSQNLPHAELEKTLSPYLRLAVHSVGMTTPDHLKKSWPVLSSDRDF
jgi:hypothetical protein